MFFAILKHGSFCIRAALNRVSFKFFQTTNPALGGIKRDFKTPPKIDPLCTGRHQIDVFLAHFRPFEIDPFSTLLKSSILHGAASNRIFLGHQIGYFWGIKSATFWPILKSSILHGAASNRIKMGCQSA